MAYLKKNLGSTTSLILAPSDAPVTTEGAVYYDSTTDKVRVYNGTAWEQVSNLVGFEAKASGGHVQNYKIGGTNYVSHTFLSSGTWTSFSTFNIDFVIIAGGGGGIESGIPGGSGAGGMWVQTGVSKDAGDYAIVVGAGGASDDHGNDSSAFTKTSPGGGSGTGDGVSTAAARNGASGGGGASGWSPAATAGGTGSGTDGTDGNVANPTYYGNDGSTGAGSPSAYANSGGGGGAGAAGVSPGTITTGGSGGRGGVGGSGLANNFRTGVNQLYAAGGSGTTYLGTGSRDMTDSIGGAGKHSASTTAAFSTDYMSGHGVTNTGSGGGFGFGGSGIVIIRYTI